MPHRMPLSPQSMKREELELVVISRSFETRTKAVFMLSVARLELYDDVTVLEVILNVAGNNLL